MFQRPTFTRTIELSLQTSLAVLTTEYSNKVQRSLEDNQNTDWKRRDDRFFSEPPQLIRCYMYILANLSLDHKEKHKFGEG